MIEEGTALRSREMQVRFCEELVVSESALLEAVDGAISRAKIAAQDSSNHEFLTRLVREFSEEDVKNVLGVYPEAMKSLEVLVAEHPAPVLLGEKCAEYAKQACAMKFGEDAPDKTVAVVNEFSKAFQASLHAIWHECLAEQQGNNLGRG